jgi:hypothetical protein
MPRPPISEAYSQAAARAELLQPRVMETAAEAKRHTDQQRACDELTCVIHDVKSPVFELGRLSNTAGTTV